MPKKQRQSPGTGKDTESCPNCGMASKDWPEGGYRLERQTYCCQGCAEQTGCTCAGDERATA
jgi:hypothetical protein